MTLWRRTLDVMRSARVALAALAVGLAAGCGNSHRAVVRSHPPVPDRSRGSFPTAVRVAKASDSKLSIFPSRPGVIRCSIPTGARTTSTDTLLKRGFIPGECRTRVRVSPSHEPALIVSFTERWPKCLQGYCTPTGGPPIRRHSWQIMVSLPYGTFRKPAVVKVNTRSTGALPPQDYP